MVAARRRPPAPVCAFCERPLELIGGKRIVWSSRAGIFVRGYGDAVGRIPSRSLLELLPEPHAGILILWPPNENALDRALDQWTSRHRPWSCQLCAHRVCGRCGHPEKIPMGSDIVDDDRRVLHVPLLPGPAGCVQQDCPG